MITVVGAGFAGVEAAWAAAQRGIPVRLYEMRPVKMTPAHTTDLFAELVCSNSFKSKSPTSPAGQLKAEMQALGSIVLKTAIEHSVPGGEALAVDRNAFGAAITERLSSHPLIEVVREEFTPAMAGVILGSGGILILATGPLTSPELAAWLAGLTGRDHLYFYDAVAPTVEASSLNYEVVFAQSRYDKGGDDYLNCPFDRDSYDAFVRELVAAERAPIHAFEAGGKRDIPDSGSVPSPPTPSPISRGIALGQPPDCGHGETDIQDSVRVPSPPTPSPVSRGIVLEQPPDCGHAETGEGALLEKIKYFSGCSPIEAIAEKGARSLAFGNFKPVGLIDPRTGRRPHAALQLRPENREKTLYSLVACQTRLKWGEQKRVFRMVPGLENAEFVRFGVIHRNTYIEAPQVLEPWLEMRELPGLFIAGQLTGVEGYVESAAMGIYAGIMAVRQLSGLVMLSPPRGCAHGSLVSHLQDATPREFSPMNINWGLFPEPDDPGRDKGIKRAKKLEKAQRDFAMWLESLN